MGTLSERNPFFVRPDQGAGSVASFDDCTTYFEPELSSSDYLTVVLNLLCIVIIVLPFWRPSLVRYSKLRCRSCVASDADRLSVWTAKRFTTIDQLIKCRPKTTRM